MSSDELALGIDLGTTYSCVAIWRNGNVEIIPNDLGARTTPSVVSFTKNERLIGQAAKNQITKNYQNTIYDSKRLIGRRYDDPEVQYDMKTFPFKIEKDELRNRLLISVEYKNQKKQFLPEEISAMILEKLKRTAEDFLGKKIYDTVLTVPAYFNDNQRQATKDAGKIAGLNIIRMINEPTAAAIAYGLNSNNNNEEKNILVFDLGGGTFDISILSLDSSLFEVRATRGDTHLGGEDFDNALMRFCIEEFKDETGIDIGNNQKVLRRLKVACEKAKRELSLSQQAEIDIDSLAEGKDFNIKITRPQFEDICKDLFIRCIKPIELALKDAQIQKDKIDDIILIGGSTRIPKIQEIVKEFFNGKELNKSINPDEAVAYGAAVQAAIVNNIEDVGLERLVLLDVAPLSLGVKVANGQMNVLIPRNTTIPCEQKNYYATADDDQASFLIEVYQGERELASQNIFLGSFLISGIRIAKNGDVLCEVTFSLDINNILHVTAVEVGGNGIEGKLDIQCKNQNLTEEEINELIKEAEKFRKDDQLKIENIQCRISYENFLNEMKQKYSNKRIIIQKINEELKWVRKNLDENISVYKNKLNDIKNFISNNS